MGYIESGKKEGATVHIGGKQLGKDGYFIEPTIFTNTKPEMKIVREEIFGPVVAIIKFEDDDGAYYMYCTLWNLNVQLLFGVILDVVRQANNSVYGLAAAVFSKNINRAVKTAHRLQAGTIWVSRRTNFSSIPMA
jgi:aldehyde dehydrogenase (NAD+)